MEDITEETANFSLKHLNSLWLSAGLVEQWINLTEYFLEFLRKQMHLKKQLSVSSRYNHIWEKLQNPAKLCFLAMIAYTQIF